MDDQRLSPLDETAPAELPELLGGAPEACARAPGRVNLIGAHLDYNEGPVLPVRVERFTWVAVRRRPDRRLNLRSRERPAEPALLDAHERGAPEWAAYPLAVVAELERRGLRFGGLDVAVASDLPIGAGLSSSASLLVATVRALSRLAGRVLDPSEEAEIAFVAETEGVGVPCGRMDPMAVAAARPGSALWYDCRDGRTEEVPLDRSRLALVIVDSGTRRALARSEFETRVRECHEAAAALRAFDPALRTLRDANEDLLRRAEGRVPAVLLRRARHVVSEVRRVREFRRALERGDLALAGRLVTECHRSLAADYEVSTPELDLLVDAATRQAGVYGARLTGAGFGGNVVVLVDPSAACAAADRVLAAAERGGLDASLVTVA